jgi:serine/threonine protein phosphatase 1
VIGDIHGRVDLLYRLHALIDQDFAQSGGTSVHVIYLGDYIDRGSDSAAVLERLARGHSDFVNVGLVRGNHEEMLLRFLKDPSVGPSWLHLGALETLASYGIDTLKVLRKDGYAGLSRQLNEALPAHHLELLESLKSSITVGDYFFCHAGVRPGVPLDQQRAEDLAWIRTSFLESRNDFGKVVVHGHTPTEQPDIRHNRINIDTGAYASGHLTCLVLEGRTRRILST